MCRAAETGAIGHGTNVVRKHAGTQRGYGKGREGVVMVVVMMVGMEVMMVVIVVGVQRLWWYVDGCGGDGGGDVCCRWIR